MSQMKDARRGPKHGTLRLHRFKDRHQRLETKPNLTPATEMGQEVIVAAPTLSNFPEPQPSAHSLSPLPPQTFLCT